MYLEKFPLLTYTFNNTEYSLVDIFRRVSFKQSTLENTSAFFTYYVQDDDTPENIARNFYKDSTLWWLVLLPNNIVSNLEFPISENYLTSFIETKYPGKVFFFSEYMPDLKSGNIIAGVTLNGTQTAIQNTSNVNYAVINEYNKTFRYAVVNEIYGNLQSNNIVGFYDSNSNELPHSYIASEDEAIKTKTWATIKSIKDQKDAPVEFLDLNSNFVSPYIINNTNDSKSTALGTYTTNDLTDTNTITNTSLFKYMTSVSDNNISTIRTIQSKAILDNEKFRSIKLLNPKYAPTVINEIISLINSNNKSISITVSV
jgi:hypothetical protein